jgi:ABC-type branched-subunit amino acid transport system ATPase component
VATCLAGSSSNWPLPARWPPSPSVLILDEPTEGIQPSIIKDIGRVIRMLADRGDMAIVLVEQYYDFAQELADDYLVMERGESSPAARARTWKPRACASWWRSESKR